MKPALVAKRSRKILARLAAVLVGLSPFVLLEAGLRLSGVSAGDSASDPLSGFNRNIPLFERQGAVYRTAKSREPYFAMQEFSVNKPTNAFRIFCFGGSTVHGHPYQSETSFPKWLELELNAINSNRTYQAINCGAISYASYRLAPLVKEVIDYAPDLIVVATGENEFLEDRTYQSIKGRSKLLGWAEDTLQSLRIVAVARGWVHHWKSNRGISSESRENPAKQEIRTRLDTPAGYASYHRDSEWHERVAAQFEGSLRQMVSTCHRARVPLLFVALGSNLRDCPPYKSEHRNGLSSEDEQRWQKLYDEAGAAENRRPAEALAAYKKAEQIDAEYALLLFRIARLLDQQGETQAALDYYCRARDEDICPLRITSRHEEILEGVAKETNTPLLDAAKIIADNSMDRIPGKDWYVDHVHPTIGGHQIIARGLAAQIRDIRIVAELAKWTDAERQNCYGAQIERLGTRYWAEGLHRVQWLESWARRERLWGEMKPRDAKAFLRAGICHLELGDEESARNEIKEALKRDSGLESEVHRYAELLVAEGRMRASEHLIAWFSKGNPP